MFGLLKKRIHSVDIKAARFIHLVLSVDDTPTLIRKIAQDRDYLSFCAAVVQNESDAGTDQIHKRYQLEKQLLKKRVALQSLRSRLMPVAVSLGLGSMGMRSLEETEGIDFYRILGLSSNATKAEVHRAYRRKALQTHPDTGSGSSENFLQIQKAFWVLSDKALRQQYDRVRSQQSWRWIEKPVTENPVEDDPGQPENWQHRHVWHLLVIIMILLGLIYLADLLNQEMSLGAVGALMSNRGLFV